MCKFKETGQEVKDFQKALDEIIEIEKIAKEDVIKMSENRFPDESSYGEVGAYYNSICEYAFIVCCKAALKGVEEGLVSKEFLDAHLKRFLEHLEKHKNKILGLDEKS